MSYRKLTPERIRQQTCYSEKLREDFETRLRDYDLDEREVERKTHTFLCRSCAYLREGSLAGQGFTEYDCGNCGTVELWYNTNVPRYCRRCSSEYTTCCRCGSSL